MIQKQEVRDRKPIKEQLRARLQEPFSLPETITEGWEKEDTLVAIAELLDELSLESAYQQRWIVLENIVRVIVVFVWGLFVWFRTYNLFVAILGLICATLATLMWHYIAKHRSKDGLVPAHLVKIFRLTGSLSALLLRVDEVRLVPQVLEAARRVPKRTGGEQEAVWNRAEEEALARLLPRMTTSEAQALTSVQRAYLGQRLIHDISEGAAVAILLTLASAEQPGSEQVAQHYLMSPSPQVREAAREYLASQGGSAT